MTKAGQWAAVGAILAAVWAAMYTGKVETNETVVSILPFVPFIFLCCFGSYSLFIIGLSLFTFGDADEAAAELVEEIKEAKADLLKHNITVPSEDEEEAS
mmetsp:Transcript_21000/g.54688  ORF Transcript_21000/g.54688 Transcript_21000/m.54688 type:complete len:100 (+) Transcript_21000:88-387(+)